MNNQFQLDQQEVNNLESLVRRLIQSEYKEKKILKFINELKGLYNFNDMNSKPILSKVIENKIEKIESLLFKLNKLSLNVLTAYYEWDVNLETEEDEDSEHIMEILKGEAHSETYETSKKELLQLIKSTLLLSVDYYEKKYYAFIEKFGTLISSYNNSSL